MKPTSETPTLHPGDRIQCGNHVGVVRPIRLLGNLFVIELDGGGTVTIQNDATVTVLERLAVCGGEQTETRGNGQGLNVAGLERGW